MQRRGLLVAGAATAVAGATYGALKQTGSMTAYGATVAATRKALPPQPQLQDLISFATLAPSGHNTQPWRFRIATGAVDILPDFSRATPVVDPDDHHLFVGLGCAAETLAIAAASCGHPGNVSFQPTDRGSVRLIFGGPPSGNAALFAAIPRRQSTRTEYDARQIKAADLTALVAAAAIPGVDLTLITDRPRMRQVRDLVLEGNSAQMADPRFVQELKAWLRFNPRAAIDTGDGLFTAASGNPILPTWLGPRLFDLLRSSAGDNRNYARQIASSSGVAVFAAEHADPQHWVRVGRACQRFMLQATAIGLKHAFINQPVEVPALRPELARVAGLPGRRPDILLRFGYGPPLPFSPRRPVRAILAPPETA